jgi:hypothetical protein
MYQYDVNYEAIMNMKSIKKELTSHRFTLHQNKSENKEN